MLTGCVQYTGSVARHRDMKSQSQAALKAQKKRFRVRYAKISIH